MRLFLPLAVLAAATTIACNLYIETDSSKHHEPAPDASPYSTDGGPGYVPDAFVYYPDAPPFSVDAGAPADAGSCDSGHH